MQQCRIEAGGHFFYYFFLGNISIRVEIEDGGRKAKVESGWLGK